MIDQSSVDLLALAGKYVTLKRVSAHDGGEYHGPCPLCGGTDRFFVNPYCDRPVWTCRRCGEHGDAIDLVRLVEGVTFVEACKLLGLEGEIPPRTIGPTRPREPERTGLLRAAEHHWPALDDTGWQKGAWRFVDESVSRLDLAGEKAWDYLIGRGLSVPMIRAASLGYNPQPYRGRWGKTDVYLPAGIVIPWIAPDETIWKVRIRTRSHEPSKKYAQAKGSANGLYGVVPVRPDARVLLCEGEFDALAAQSVLPFAVTALATGGYSQARIVEHVVTLSQARTLWLAFDDDEAGETAATWWRGVFPDAIRRVPWRHDVNDMVVAGDDLAAWLAGEAVTG